MLEPLDLRQHLLHTSGPTATLLEDHVAMARPTLDIASATIQLLLALPAASASSPGAGPELLKLLSAVIGSFTLSANLPTGCGASQSQPQATARMLQLVTARSLLPRLLLLLRREFTQPAWHANALLGIAVALSWALGASVPLSALYDPSGVLGAPARTAEATLPMTDGWRAWRSLRAALTPSSTTTTTRAFLPQVVANMQAIELLLTVLATLLRDRTAPSATSLALGALPTPTAAVSGAASRGAAAAAGVVSIRLAGGFLLHAEHAYTADQRIELLFALPGSTMLDTLIGLLLAASLLGDAGAASKALEPPAPGSDGDAAMAQADGDAREATHEGPAPDTLDDLLSGMLLPEASDGSRPLGGAAVASSKGAGGDAVVASGGGTGAGGSGGSEREQWRLIERLIDFLNLAMRGEGFAPSLPAQLRLHLATRHLRAYTLLLQFGVRAVREPHHRALRARLRQFGTFCCAKRLLSGQMHLNLVRGLMHDGSWPLCLPIESIVFHSRVLLERLRVRTDAAADDAFHAEVIGCAISSLKACALDAAHPASHGGAGGGTALLPLQHMQLLMLLWHSLSEVAKADLLTQAAAALCAMVDSARAATRGKSPALGGVQWLALLRSLQMVQYMLHCFDAVPTLLPAQLQALLLAPPQEAQEAAGTTPLERAPSAAETPAAADGSSTAVSPASDAAVLVHALVAFDPNYGRLSLGEACGDGSGTAAVPASAPAKPASLATTKHWRGPQLVSGGSGGGGVGAKASAQSKSLVFSSCELYELVPHGGDGACATALSALASRSSACSSERLHASLASLLELLHASPSITHATAEPLPAAGVSRVAISSSMKLVLAAQTYHLSWRLLGALPVVLEPERSPAGSAPPDESTAPCALQKVRQIWTRAASDAPGGDGLPQHCAELVAEMATAEGASLQRTAALTTALALCLERLAQRSGAEAASFLGSEAALSGVLGNLAGALACLMRAVRSEARQLLPPALHSDADVANALLACCPAGSRLSQLLAASAGASSSAGCAAAARAIKALGEPLALLRIGASSAGGSPTTASHGGGDALLHVLLTHLLAPLSMSMAPYGAGSSSKLNAASAADSPMDERRSHSDRERKEAAAAAAAAVATAAAAAAAVSAVATRASESDRSEREEAAAMLLHEAEAAADLLRAQRDCDDEDDEDDEDEDEGEQDEQEGEDDEEDGEDDDGEDGMPDEDMAADPEMRVVIDAPSSHQGLASSPRIKAAPEASPRERSIPLVQARSPTGRKSHEECPEGGEAPLGSTATVVPSTMVALATLQLAMSALLRATLAVVRAAAAAPLGGGQLRRCSHALVQSLLPVEGEPCFAFVHSDVSMLLAELVPEDALRCYADLRQLRRMERFIVLCQQSQGTLSAAEGEAGGSQSSVGGESTASESSAGMRQRSGQPSPEHRSELVVGAVGECVDALEAMVSHPERQGHVALFYSGVLATASAGTGGSGTRDASLMEVDGSVPTPSSDSLGQLPFVDAPGDLSLLIHILHAPGTGHLCPHVLSLLLRILALRPAAPDTVLAPCAPEGAKLSPARGVLTQHLSERLLGMDEAMLEEWLRAKLKAGPLGSEARTSYITAVLPAAKSESHSAQAGAPASAAQEVPTVWSLVSRLVSVLLPHGDAPSAEAAAEAKADASQLHAALGDRLWLVLRRILIPLFTVSSWSDSSCELFETLRYLATVTRKLPQLVQLAIEVLTQLKRTPSETSPAPTAMKPQAPRLLLEFLEEALEACQPSSKVAGRGKKPSNEHQSDADDDVASDKEDGGDAGADTEAEGADLADGDGLDDPADQQAALAHKCCTFSATGSNFTEQHWYYCYTCGLTQSEGCCSVCVKVCHAGHIVSYSRRSRFFCDCGAGAAAARGIHCIALKPRRANPPSLAASKASQPRELTTSRGDRASMQHSSAARRAAAAAPSTGASCQRMSRAEPISLNEDERVALLQYLSTSGYAEALFSSYSWLLAALRKALPVDAEPGEIDLFSPSKPVSVSSDLLSLRHSVRAGAFDLKLKTDGPYARELRSQLGTGVLLRSVLAASSKGLLALAEADKLHILDTQPALNADAKLAASSAAAAAAAASGSAAAAVERVASSASGGSGSTSDRAGLRSVSKTSLGFEAVCVTFNPSDEQQLLVSGLKDCVVLTLGSRGEVLSRLVVELLLDSLGLGMPVHLIKAGWLPHSSSQCYVLTNHFLKIYDLARDKISPSHHFQTLDDSIKDVAFLLAEHAPPPPGSSATAGTAAAAGGLILLAITASGTVFSQSLRTANCANGPHYLTDALMISPELRGRVGAALHYSAPCSLLITVYADSRCYALRLNDSATEVLGGFAIHTTRIDYLSSGSLGGSKSACAPYSHWQDVPGQRGMLMACCRKTLIPLALKVTPTGVSVQVLKPYAKAEGVCTAPTSRRTDGSPDGPTVCWVLHEDGSMQCHTCGQMANSEMALTAALSRAHAKRPPSRAPVFPVEFFERATCVTASADITLGGDVVHNSTPTNAKARLSSNTDDYVSGPTKSSLTLHINNAAASQVVVGVRLLLGSAHPQHIPASFTLFNRTITTQEGQRRWYDVPFTEAEALIGQRQVTIVFSGTHTGANVPVIDALDVYAQTKVDFGWEAQLARTIKKYKLAPPSQSRHPRAEEVAAQEPQASTLRTLECSLRQLAAFQRLAPEPPTPPQPDGGASLREEMLRALPSVLTAGPSCGSLRAPAKRLLRQLLPEKSLYLELKDEALLRHAAACIGADNLRGGSAGEAAMSDDAAPPAVAPTSALRPGITATSLLHLINTVQRIVRKRPRNLFKFVQAQPQFFSLLCAAFRSVQAPAARLSKLPALTRAVVQLLLSCAEQSASSASTEAAVADDSAPEAARPYFKHLFELLLHGNEAVRFTSSAAIATLLLNAPSITNAVARGGGTAPTQAARISVDMGDMGMLVSGADEEDPMELDGNETADETSAQAERAAGGASAGASLVGGAGVQFCCDLCGKCPITEVRWHCEVCQDFDLCNACYAGGDDVDAPPHTPDHELLCLPIVPPDSAASLASALAGQSSDALAAAPSGDDVGKGPSSDMRLSDGEEDVMLAMAVAMSLGAEAAQPPAAASEGATGAEAQAMVVGGEGSAQSASTARPALRSLAVVLFDVMVASLPSIATLDGLSALPYLQLLHCLAMHRDINGGGWRRLADQLLAQLLPTDTEGDASTALVEAVQVCKRSAALEIHVLLLLFLRLLLARHSSSGESGTSGAGMPSSAAAMSAEATDPLAAPGQREAMRGMQKELTAYLCERGLPEALYAEAQRLYDHFKESASQRGDSQTATSSGLLASKDTRPSVRQLTPFFSDEYAKLHSDPFGECQSLVFDALLRLAQRLHPATGPTTAVPMTLPPALPLALASPNGSSPTVPPGDLVPRWLSLLCLIIHSSSTAFVRKQAKKHLLQLCGTKARYLEVRDRGLADSEMRRIRHLLANAGASSTPTAAPAAESQHPLHLPYEQQVKLCNSLQRLHEMATAQPLNWAKYCASADSDGTLCLLMRSLMYVQGEGLLGMLRLLSAGLKSGKSVAGAPSTALVGTGSTGSASKGTGGEVPPVSLQALLETPLDKFIASFVLQGASAAIRKEACAVLHALWVRADELERSSIFQSIREQMTVSVWPRAIERTQLWHLAMASHRLHRACHTCCTALLRWPRCRLARVLLVCPRASRCMVATRASSCSSLAA